MFRFWSYRKFVWRLAPTDDSGTGAVPGPPAPSGQPSAAGQVVQPDAERLSPAEAGAATPHVNGHDPGPGRASRVVLPELARLLRLIPGPGAPWVPGHEVTAYRSGLVQ